MKLSLNYYSSPDSRHETKLELLSLAHLTLDMKLSWNYYHCHLSTISQVIKYVLSVLVIY